MIQRRWLSFLLLWIAYITFGWFLNSHGASHLGWGLAVAFALGLAGVLSLVWRQARAFVLLGFQSDTGYFVMVLALASLAVAALAWVQIFAYLMVMVAAALLVRVDLLAMELGSAVSFLALAGIPLAGLGTSWWIYGGG
ncbi:MAG: hypothetical protein AAGF66_00070 [Cyanobacteria bacterium P01_H01_bin.119]